MNHRQRFLRHMHHEPVDHAPYWTTSGWSQTMQRWHTEGLPKGTSLDDYFGADKVMGAGVYYGPLPHFETQILSDDGEKQTMVNHEGIIQQVYVHDTDRSMPHFIEFPVKNRDDYRRLLKPRLTGPAEDHLPPDWNQRVEIWKNRSDPLCLFGDRWAGFFGPLRNMMGLEALSYAFYDDPALIEEMMDDIADNVIAITSRILEDVEIDYWGYWEDMGMKTGPLLSPALFKKYMVPRYRRVNDVLRSKGVDFICVDSDGDCRALIPDWLDSGINGLWPLEIAASMEPEPIKREYGKDLILFGGIDKRALAAGRDAIDEEMKKVPPLVAQGGYIPTVDHGCPPDISWENYCYYMEKQWEAVQTAGT